MSAGRGRRLAAPATSQAHGHAVQTDPPTPLNMLVSLRKLQTEHAALQQQHVELHAGHSALQQQMKELTSKNAVLESENAVLKQEKSKLERENRHLSERCTRAAVQAREATARACDSEAKLAAAEQQLVQARDTSLRGWREMAGLERQVGEARVRQQQAEVHVQELQQVCTERENALKQVCNAREQAFQARLSQAALESGGDAYNEVPMKKSNALEPISPALLPQQASVHRSSSSLDTRVAKDRLRPPHELSLNLLPTGESSSSLEPSGQRKSVGLEVDVSRNEGAGQSSGAACSPTRNVSAGKLHPISPYSRAAANAPSDARAEGSRARRWPGSSRYLLPRTPLSVNVGSNVQSPSLS
uniref:Uncharacterized protein n=1 Tax=Chrysotila carterae TaxID=13221 RepID=A0A7S4FB62_CHRCT|mmetsp:Transcript_22471/g.49063  ORF Transcript_22471/g.49063 Transcript_22471/m.49063 type:complete len:359 (+) Transcript_22471:324-1400(+)